MNDKDIILDAARDAFGSHIKDDDIKPMETIKIPGYRVYINDNSVLDREMEEFKKRLTKTLKVLCTAISFEKPLGLYIVVVKLKEGEEW